MWISWPDINFGLPISLVIKPVIGPQRKHFDCCVLGTDHKENDSSHCCCIATLFTIVVPFPLPGNVYSSGFIISIWLLFWTIIIYTYMLGSKTKNAQWTKKKTARKRCGFRETATRNFASGLFLKSHIAFWHFKNAMMWNSCRGC
jgi:hypothetical protein